MNERQGLTPGHWIAIATIAVGVLGGVIGVALGEHNARLGNVETTMRTIAEAQTRMAEAQARMAEALARTEVDLAGFRGTGQQRLRPHRGQPRQTDPVCTHRSHPNLEPVRRGPIPQPSSCPKDHDREPTAPGSGAWSRPRPAAYPTWSTTGGRRYHPGSGWRAHFQAFSWCHAISPLSTSSKRRSVLQTLAMTARQGFFERRCISAAWLRARSASWRSPV